MGHHASRPADPSGGWGALPGEDVSAGVDAAFEISAAPQYITAVFPVAPPAPAADEATTGEDE